MRTENGSPLLGDPSEAQIEIGLAGAHGHAAVVTLRGEHDRSTRRLQVDAPEQWQ